MDDEVVRIAKKMDKMVQKKNAVSGRVPGRPRPRPRLRPTRSQPVRAGPRALPASTSVLTTSAVSPGAKPSPAERRRDGRGFSGCRGPFQAGGKSVLIPAPPHTRIAIRQRKPAVS